jgi:DNA-binding response OmpR family regulator
LEKRQVLINDKKLKTTLTEFRLLEYLIRNQNRFCTRTMLHENVWGSKEHISNAISVTVSKLRSKIKNINNGNDIIHTVPRSGYRVY